MYIMLQTSVCIMVCLYYGVCVCVCVCVEAPGVKTNPNLAPPKKTQKQHEGVFNKLLITRLPMKS